MMLYFGYCRSKRFIGPNEGFTEQLIELNDSVHNKKHDIVNCRNV